MTSIGYGAPVRISAPAVSRVRAESVLRVFAVAAACIFAAIQNPTSARADDAARISRLESEIQLLRSQVDAQNRRIQKLEAELSRRADAPAVKAQPSSRASEMRTDQTASTARLPWHAPEAWDRLAREMTAEQVQAILGEPSAVEAIGSLKTFFYRGAVPGLAALNGHVNFRDDRVVAVVKPAF